MSGQGQSTENDAPQPGDLCRYIKGPEGEWRVEHVAPCVDGHRTGTVTDLMTGRVIPPGVTS